MVASPFFEIYSVKYIPGANIKQGKLIVSGPVLLMKKIS